MAAALKTAGSYLLSAFSFIPMPGLSSSKREEDPFKNELDPISLIINLATASLLPVGIKPTQINHHIKWEKPLKYGVKNAELDVRWTTREYENRRGEGIAKKEVTDFWEKTIEKAAHWYEPYREENKTIKLFFERALKGLTIVKETYKGEIDKNIDKCIKAIKVALNKKRILEKENLLDKIQDICKEIFNNRLDLYSPVISKDELTPEQKFDAAWKDITATVEEDWYNPELYETEVMQNFLGKAIQVIQRHEKHLKDKLLLQTLNECFTKLSLADKMKRIWQKFDFDKIDYTLRESAAIIETEKKDPSDEIRIREKIKVITAIVNDRCNEFSVILKRSFKDL